jgi:hypothetical protein
MEDVQYSIIGKEAIGKQICLVDLDKFDNAANLKYSALDSLIGYEKLAIRRESKYGKTIRPIRKAS